MAGCSYYQPIREPAPHNCIVIARAAHTDTLIVGSYPPPCNKIEQDTVTLWKIHFPRECTVIGTFNPNDTRAKVNPTCPDKPDYVEVAS